MDADDQRYQVLRSSVADEFGGGQAVRAVVDSLFMSLVTHSNILLNSGELPLPATDPVELGHAVAGDELGATLTDLLSSLIVAPVRWIRLTSHTTPHALMALIREIEEAHGAGAAQTPAQGRRNPNMHSPSPENSEYARKGR